MLYIFIDKKKTPPEPEHAEDVIGQETIDTTSQEYTDLDVSNTNPTPCTSAMSAHVRPGKLI